MANIPDIGLGGNFPQRPRDALDPNVLDDRDMLGEEDDMLGVEGLETINLIGETVRLFRQTKRLLSRVLVNTMIPVNQQAQVATALAAQLKSLSQQQTDLYNAERLKRLEAVTVRLVRDMVPEMQDRFMAEYEREVALVIRGAV